MSYIPVCGLNFAMLKVKGFRYKHSSGVYIAYFEFYSKHVFRLQVIDT